MMPRLLRPLVRVNFGRYFSVNSQNMQQQMYRRKGAELPEKIKQAQKLFQEKNNLPVFLKGGPKDKILYYTTLGLAGLGLTLNIIFLAGYVID